MLFFYPESVVSNRLLKRHLAYKFFCRNLSDHMHIEVDFVWIDSVAAVVPKRLGPQGVRTFESDT